MMNFIAFKCYHNTDINKFDYTLLFHQDFKSVSDALKMFKSKIDNPTCNANFNIVSSYTDIKYHGFDDSINYKLLNSYEYITYIIVETGFNSKSYRKDHYEHWSKVSKPLIRDNNINKILND